MNISFSYSSAPDIVQKLAAVIYKADANGNAVGGIVASQQFDPPHTSPRNVTFTGLDPVVYIVNTYETPGLPALGQLRNSFIYDPEFSEFDIKVQSLKMVAGGASYNVPDTSWNGYKVLSINERGVGNLDLPEYDTNGIQINTATYEVQVRDKDTDNPKGFDVMIPNFQFGDQERFEVTLISRITSVTPTITYTKVVGGERIITNDASVTAGDTNKGIRLQGATGVLLPLL